MSDRTLELKAHILKALAQPTRLKILESLREGEKCVCEIYPAVNGEQSNISKHLSIMQSANLLTSRKEGIRVLFNVKYREVFDIVDTVSHLLRKHLEENAELMQAI
jgi:DNA-binding transcriptional ArsR family regulator